MNTDDPTILLVEDDRIDAMAVRRALKDLHIASPIVEARNGIEALAHLRGDDEHARLPSPCLVLLDLKMPQMGGLEFLAELRQDPALHSTLVIVLTTSDADEDRIRAYNSNVAGYILKHDPEQRFADAIAVLAAYWRLIKFPPVGRDMVVHSQPDSLRRSPMREGSASY
jgi:CheY-like chemotaxis protein